MRILVCLKHVPDIQSERALGPDNRMVRGADDGTLNELDEYAVQAAHELVEAQTAAGTPAELVVLTVGPPEAVTAVRKGLQLGAAQAVHVQDDAVAGSDALGTARVLAAAVRHLDAQAPVDLVITGMAGLDGLTSLVPAALAAELGLPALPLASDLSVDVAARTVRVRRDLDHATEVLEAALPAVVSVTDQANRPRYPSFQGIMAARSMPVTTLTLADLGLDPATVGAAGARTEVLDAAPRPAREDRVLLTDEGDAGLRLAEYLVDRGLA